MRECLAMIIGGLQKFSLLDYPGNLAAIIFTQGCNFHCQFCYNPMLVWPSFRASKLKQKDHYSHIEEDDLFAFLKKRIGKLDAVVITGGEPTIHKDLPDFIKKIKKLGYKVKLDTNGTNPDMIKKLIEKDLIDYIAMDIKAPASKYKKITGKATGFEKIKKSVNIIIKSSLSPSNWAGKYEFRTTIVPGLINKDDIIAIGRIIKGADQWYLQQIKQDTELINRKLEKVKQYSKKEIEEMCKIAKNYVKKCKIR